MTIIILIVLVLLLSAVSVAKDIKSRKRDQAIQLYIDMLHKYIELKVSSSNFELTKLLPIFEEADKICARDCSDMKFPPISSRVRDLLDNKKDVYD